MIKTINVTQKHIDKGLRNNCQACPVALALREQTPYVNCMLDSSSIFWGDKDATYSKVPYNVKTFIHNFDGIFGVEPFSFNIEMP